MHLPVLKRISVSSPWARWPARLLVGVLAGSFFLFLGIPLAGLIIREPPAMVWQAIQQPEAIEALQLSLITTTISTLLALVFGLPVAGSLQCLPCFRRACILLAWLSET